MAGRRSHHDKNAARREQGEKKIRGFARGHGAHHRHQAGKEAPRNIGTGRDRTHEIRRQREFGRLDDDQLHDLESGQRHATGGRSVEELGDAVNYGSALDGEQSAGTVVEVRKGNFLTLMNADSVSDSERAFRWKRGDVLKTFVRGTMQQFDTGLSSLVAAGDEIRVIVPPMSEDKSLYKSDLHAILTHVLPRRSEFRRMHPSGRSIQTIAANVDQVVVVASTAQPDFRPGFIDRVLVCAAACNLPALLVVNKMDLGLRDADEELLGEYVKLGIPVFRVSAASDSPQPEWQRDFEAFRKALAGKRTTLTGHSGVGKSSLLRALNPALDPDVVRTGDVSTQTQKGTHTTTHARLFRLELADGECGELIDTPGVREFTPADTDRRNLWGWFPEIARYQGQCSFSDCTHTKEKGCAVLAAVEAGEIHPRRHHSYVRILETLPM